MFKPLEKKPDSPRTVNFSEAINKQNLNNINNNINNNHPYMTQTFNINDLNFNRQYNHYTTISQGNKSFMTASQLLDYSIANEEIKRRKNLGILDMTSHRNKDIFIETDSEQYNSRRNSLDSHKKKRKRCCSKLIVDKVTSHMPNTYYSKGRKTIKSNNYYDPYSIQTYNSLNLNDINNNDTYEFEKSEKITIKKVNYIPQQVRQTPTTEPNNNINNRIEEKKIILHKIKNRNPNINNNNINYNNIYDKMDPLINKEKELNDMRRTNNISNFDSNYKYPFVIPTNNKKNNNYVPYRYNNNNIPSNDFGSNNYNNNYYYPERDNNNSDYISVNESSENKISPIKQNQFAFHKKRIYNNNSSIYKNKNPSILKLSNILNKNNNNIDEQFSENNNDSDDINSYRDNNNDNDNEKKDYDYDSKFERLYLNKDKEYNNLLDDYNDIVAKYNKLQRLYSKLINEKNENREDETTIIIILIMIKIIIY